MASRFLEDSICTEGLAAKLTCQVARTTPTAAQAAALVATTMAMASEATKWPEKVAQVSILAAPVGPLALPKAAITAIMVAATAACMADAEACTTAVVSSVQEAKVATTHTWVELTTIMDLALREAHRLHRTTFAIAARRVGTVLRTVRRMEITSMIQAKEKAYRHQSFGKMSLHRRSSVRSAQLTKKVS